MMILTSALGDSRLPIGEAGVLAFLGYAVVFFGIILLMLVVIAMGRVFIARDKKAAAIQEAAHAAAQAQKAEAPKPLAPGAAGELKLHDVEPRTAAMLMAIVADKMGKPLNELRFISIKEVK
ncbi:MAG: hypothetical protein EGQ87_07260 [Clostridiales bacterium]|jgi:Na+-transporting methylmalonyl-CoA/oxaloacetate decarboxylase gamma subunit|nr:hypothetical protein [Clostridiales bacterium]